MKIEIAITDTDGKPSVKTVRARPFGALAVHPTSMRVGGQSFMSDLWYTVTHVSTGRSIFLYIEDRRSAVKVARRLQEIADWGFGTMEEFAERKATLKTVCETVAREYDMEDGL